MLGARAAGCGTFPFTLLDEDSRWEGEVNGENQASMQDAASLLRKGERGAGRRRYSLMHSKLLMAGLVATPFQPVRIFYVRRLSRYDMDLPSSFYILNRTSRWYPFSQALAIFVRHLPSR